MLLQGDSGEKQARHGVVRKYAILCGYCRMEFGSGVSLKRGEAEVVEL